MTALSENVIFSQSPCWSFVMETFSTPFPVSSNVFSADAVVPQPSVTVTVYFRILVFEIDI
ncbi:MAG: hypothetical protein IPO48_10770 [Saprospiraceae bacterium]|nr:hypothetical protein [Saprospiraceae bacterium]